MRRAQEKARIIAQMEAEDLEDGVRRDRSVPTTSATATETVPIAAGSQGNTANRDYESVVLDRMRRAQEKARIIAQMEAEDLEEEK
jgi:hypothetical protein